MPIVPPTVKIHKYKQMLLADREKEKESPHASGHELDLTTTVRRKTLK